MCRVAKNYLVTMAAQTTTTQEVCHCRFFCNKLFIAVTNQFNTCIVLH